MEWNKTSKVCIALYGTLIQLEQINKDTAIMDAGDITMEFLQFFNLAASGEEVMANATQTAFAMDNLFINAFLGTYKSGFNKIKARAAMVEVMIDKDKTVADLGTVVDKIYQF